MKRIISVLLCLVIVVMCMSFLSGCGTKKSFQVGFGKVDISPGEGVELGGYGNSAVRQSRGVWTPLEALALVLTDTEDNTLVLVVTDLSFGDVTRTAQIRTEVNKKYSIPKENVMVGGTHNHNAPDYSSSNAKNVEYMEQWKQNVMKAIDQAMEDRKPATMEIGRTETENLVFSRRYVREDGNYIGGGPDSYNVPSTAPIAGHETEGDEEIQMVRFVREEGKDILLTQWQSHACNIDSNRDKDQHYMASGEWPQVMRSEVEAELGVHCMYIQGAAGNMGCASRIEGEFALEDSTDFQAIGRTLAEYITEACNKDGVFQSIETGIIRTDQNKMEVTRQDGTVVKADEKKPELNTIAIGDLSLITSPMELFDTSAKWLKDETPYDMTLIMGYTCGHGGYQAPEWAFDHLAYEVLESTYEKGTAEKMMNYYLDTLNEFYNAK